MKKTILTALIMVLGQTANASSYFIECSTAEGSITNVTGHAMETQVRYYDWGNKEHVTEDVPMAELEVLEKLTEISSKTNQGECQPGQSATFGGSEAIYVIKGKLTVPADASEKVKEIAAQPKVFLCKESWSWQSICE